MVYAIAGTVAEVIHGAHGAAGYPKSGDDVAGLVLAYEPDANFCERLQRLLRQVHRVFVVVDDGLRFDDLAAALGVPAAMNDVSLHALEGNKGIAAALNLGSALAHQAGYAWMITLDDDTVVDGDLVARLLATWQNASADGGRKIACIGIRRVDANTHQKSGRSSHERDDYTEVLGNITSACLTSIESVRATGGFREELFIDAVDYDFCLRARRFGYRILRRNDIGMTHSLGCATRHAIGPLTVTTTNHSPLRRYYMYRNSTVVARENWRSEPAYALGTIAFQLKTLVLLCLFEDNTKEKITAAFRGIRDGWQGALGPALLSENCGA